MSQLRSRLPAAARRRPGPQDTMRAVLIVIGIGLGVVGLIHLIPELPRSQDKITFLEWFVAPPILSDALAIPIIVAIGWAARRWLPISVRRPVLTGLVLSAALIAVALPFLGRPGLHPGNDSLLNRNYPLGLAVYLIVVWVAMAGWAVARHRRGPRAGTAKPAQPQE